MPQQEPQTARPPATVRPRWRSGGVQDARVALAIGLLTLASLLATSRDYAMVWDEGHTIRRELLLEEWFSWLAHPPANRTRSDAFSRRNLAIHWPFSREEPDGHPPFYALLGLAGKVLMQGLVHPLTAYRFGPMVLFSITTGVVFLHIKRTLGWAAGATSAAAMVAMPRSFSHAHYAHYDMPMSCLWLLAQVAFVKSLSDRRWAVPFGISLGLAAGTKFTGWFAAAPAVLWVGMVELPRVLARLRGHERDFKAAGLRALALAIPVAALTLYLIQPPWWTAPWDGIRRFLTSNLTRSATKPIPTLYLGDVYEFSLPWHNTLVLTAVTTPVMLLLLGVLGILAGLRAFRTEPWKFLWVLSWGTLMVVRALPNAPGHDGIRLFLPSIVSLAVLAGIGVAALWKRATSRGLQFCVYALALLAAGEGLAGIARLYPYTLSYYNDAFGGLPAAERNGFELTYYWDTLSPDFFRWVRREAPKGELELGFPTPLYNMRFLREWGDLPAGVKASGAGPLPLRPSYVLQRRRGVFFPYDDWIDRNGRAIFRISRQGVDLLRVFPYSETLRAYEAAKDMPVPEYLRRGQILHSIWPEAKELRDEPGRPSSRR